MCARKRFATTTSGLPSDGFLGRLKSHKVIQWTLAYAALAYTLLHGVEMVAGALSWPHVISRVLTLVLILGIPVIATLAWYHGAPRLEIITTFYDPELYSAPWSTVRIFAWRPDMSIFKEYNCELQVGAPDGLTRYGLVAKPEDD